MPEQKIILSLMNPLLVSMSDDSILEVMRIAKREFDEILTKYTYVEGKIDFKEEILKVND